MNAPQKITPPKALSASERLSIIIEHIDALNGSGELADGPTELLNALLTDGDNAARELREWLGEQGPIRFVGKFEEWAA